MPKRRRKPQLPRLTLLALNRQELVGFVTAVERIRHLAVELAELIDRVKVKTAPRKSVTGMADGTRNESGKGAANDAR